LPSERIVRFVSSLLDSTLKASIQPSLRKQHGN
jgi:hypothetical protein